MENRPLVKILVISLLVGAAFWVLDTFVEWFIFSHPGFWDLLIANIPPHEMHVRAIETILFVGASLITYIYIVHLNAAKEALQAARDGLEHRVEERTVELLQANKRLVQEVEERYKAEEALKESGQKLRFLTSQLLETQEVERRRLSKELHEELGQALPAMKLQVKAIKDKLRPDQDDLAEECLGLLRYHNEVIDYIRRLSKDLSPAILEDLGLTSALDQLMRETCKTYGIDSWALDMDEINDAFPAPAQINIYRILQEILLNIGKHAGATVVSLAIKKQDGKVSFTLRDNGKGFDVQQLQGEPLINKLGVTAIGERVQMLGGTLDLQSKIGAGTRVSFEIPIK